MATAKWVEVWTDTSSNGLRFLVLRGLDDGQIELLSPHNDNKVLASYTSYEKVSLELLADEYDLLEGRTEI